MADAAQDKELKNALAQMRTMMGAEDASQLVAHRLARALKGQPVRVGDAQPVQLRRAQEHAAGAIDQEQFRLYNEQLTRRRLETEQRLVEVERTLDAADRREVELERVVQALADLIRSNFGVDTGD